MRRAEYLIDARAIIDPGARLGKDVAIGPWTIIGPDVEIGDACRIASHVVIQGPTRMGANNQVFQFASIGDATPARAWQGEPTALHIGEGNVFREGVTVHRGTAQDQGVTRVGNRGLFMAYVHIGHDCTVGDDVIMANNASVAGHCTVGDHANFGGYAGVPQRRRIGAHAHVAAMSLVLKDVPACVTVAGNPAGAVGINLEGLRRRGYSDAVLARMRHAYRLLFRAGQSPVQACAQLLQEYPDCALIAELAASVRDSHHGVIRPRDGRQPG